MDRNGAPKNEVSLSDLVELFLGKPLSKLQQLSNWNKETLSGEQTAYAATDAAVLLRVYNAMKTDPAYAGIFDAAVEVVKEESIAHDFLQLK